ncbi:MAG: UvrD-helicase domain-containing protein [Oscillospiraceae bacterium]|nr:UvrD-helicase domain-containing protein [Oscillospiraceae bacterium]
MSDLNKNINIDYNGGIDLFAGLNGSQSEAVGATEGYYRIIAGAGSGKTRTLTHRFAYLVRELGISPRNILCVTFTNKAANEMRGRIKRILGDGYDSGLITTYHGFCVKVLKEDINRLFFPSNFKILDAGRQKKIIDEIYAEYEIKLDYNSFEKILEYIYRQKAHLKYIPMMIDPAYSFSSNNPVSLEERIYIKYLDKQKKIYGLDFNDLLYFVIYLFENNEDVLEKWKSRLHYIQVDEFQDSSKKELDIINMLCKGNNNLFVVGDPDQNIYEWRNSDNRFLAHFDKNYPNVKTIFLTQNYRSTPEILSVSNSLIEKNQNRIPKELFTKNQNGRPVEHVHLKDEDEEGRWIVSKIKDIVKSKNPGNLYGDIAVLFRSSYVSRFIEQSLQKENIPYVIHGGVRFFDRMEIRDSIAFLKLINDGEDEAFLRIINVPKRQIGKTRIEFLKNMRERYKEEYGVARDLSLFEVLCDNYEHPVFYNTQAGDFIDIIKEFREKAKEPKTKISEILNGVLEKTGYKAYISRSGDMERFDNVTELLSSITDFEQQAGEDVTLEAYLQELSIISDYESERNQNCVKLMTIHSSKGLEFPHVIIAGMTDGVFPSRRTLEERKLEGLEEERRLCYVAMTRAMRELYIVESEGNTYGEAKKLPSRFIYDINQEYLHTVGVVSEDIIKDLAVKIKKTEGITGFAPSGSSGSPRVTKPIIISPDANRFKTGDFVSHKVFGPGEIIETDEQNDAYLIKFENSEKAKPINTGYPGLTRLTEGREQTIINRNAEREKYTETAKPEAKPKSAVVKRPSREPEIFDFPEETEEETATEELPPSTPLTPPSKREAFAESAVDAEIETQPEEIAIDVGEAEIDRETNAAPVALYGAPPQILYDNDGRVNLWEDPGVPKKGWVCVDVIDLGQPYGECGMCGKEDIRYVHIMRHEEHQSIGAGCVCGGKMEGNTDAAKERENSLKNKINRFKTFSAAEFKTSAKGNLYTKYKNTIITFMQSKKNIFNTQDKKEGSSWNFVEGGEFSAYYKTLDEAKRAAFEKVDGRRE